MKKIVFIILVFITNNAIALQDISTCLEKMAARDRNATVTCVREQVDNEPKNANLHVLLGTVYSSFNEPINALDQYSKALKLDPKNCQAYSMRGTVYVYQNKNHEAIEDLTKATQFCGKHGLLSGSLYSQLAAIYSKMKLYDKAIENYQKSLSLLKAITPKEWDEVPDKTAKNNLIGEIYQGLCVMYMTTNKASKGVESCKAGIEYAPNNVSLKANLGSGYIEINDNNNAIIILESIYNQVSSLFVVNYNLALANKNMYKQTLDKKYLNAFEKYKKIAVETAKTDSDKELIEMKLKVD